MEAEVKISGLQLEDCQGAFLIFNHFLPIICTGNNLLNTNLFGNNLVVLFKTGLFSQLSSVKEENAGRHSHSARISFACNLYAISSCWG